MRLWSKRADNTTVVLEVAEAGYNPQTRNLWFKTVSGNEYVIHDVSKTASDTFLDDLVNSPVLKLTNMHVYPAVKATTDTASGQNVPF